MATRTEVLADRYGAAWNAHDVEAILQWHDHPSTFHVVGVTEPATGHEAIRDAASGLFELFPDIEFAPRRILTSEHLVVAQFTARATLAKPLPIGAVVVQPSGRPVEFEGVDVIPISNGLVSEKITYLDTLTIQQQLTDAATEAEPSAPAS